MQRQIRPRGCWLSSLGAVARDGIHLNPACRGSHLLVWTGFDEWMSLVMLVAVLLARSLCVCVGGSVGGRLDGVSDA